MANVGNRLMAERERRGLPRVDVARATGIYIHHLSALEHGNFEDLPDGVTVAGYVRNYAAYLGLDAAGLLTDFCNERGIEEPVELPALRSGAWAVGSLTRLLALGVTALGLVIAVVLWARSDREPAPGGAVPPEGIAPPAATVPGPQARPGQADLATEAAAGPEAAAPPDAEARSPVSTLAVPEHGVGSGVVDRRLVGIADRFAAGSRVWFWTRVRGGRSGQTIRHVWIRDGKVAETIPLTLGGGHWRTYSVKTVYPGSTGRWAVEARDENGTVLARSEFTCGP